nr:chorismate lyase [Marinifaba aquimaris]
MTAKLKEHCNSFNVDVVYESWHEKNQRINQICPAALETMPDSRYLVRQVILRCDNAPWVFASTLIPQQTLEQGNEFLGCLGSRSLGEAIFQSEHLTREPIEICPFSVQSLPREINPSVTKQVENIWARRSIFKLANLPLSVSEIFLPNQYVY